MSLRNALLLCCALLCSGIAIGAPVTPKAGSVVARETAVCQAAQDRQIEVFAGFLDPGYAGVYGDGRHLRDAEVDGLRQESLRGFKLESVTARRLDAHTELVTGKLTVQRDVGGSDIAGS